MESLCTDELSCFLLFNVVTLSLLGILREKEVDVAITEWSLSCDIAVLFRLELIITSLV